MISLNINGSGITIIDRRTVQRKRIISARSDNGYVYALRSLGMVKVGFAKSVKIRVRQLQTGCPGEIEILAAHRVKYPRTVETLWHSRLRRYHVRGEWFEVPADELKFVVESLRRGLIPENAEIEWAGLIEQCRFCGDRAYRNGWCFGCGKQAMPGPRFAIEEEPQ
jgi:hypothetical protein